MLYKKFSRAFALSVFTSALLIGCGSSSNNNSNTNSDTTIGGNAVDGYLRYSTVCLDLNNDGYCQSSAEPTTTTKKDGSFSLTLTSVQKETYPDYANSDMIVFGGQDSDTMKDFNHKLKAPFNSSGVINITPITTMVSAVKKSGVTQAQAKEKVASILGVSEEELLSDPVAKAKEGNSKALSAALQVQKMVEVLVTAASQDDNVSSGKSQKEITDSIFEAIAIGATATDLNVSSDSSETVAEKLAKVLDKASEDETAKAKMGTKAQAVTAAAKVMAKNVQEAVENIAATSSIDTTDMAQIALSIDKTKQKIEQKVEEVVASETIEKIEFNDTLKNELALVTVSQDDVKKELLTNTLVQSGMSQEQAQSAAQQIEESNTGFKVGDDFSDLQKKLESTNNQELETIAEVIAEKVKDIEDEVAKVDEPIQTTNEVDIVLSTTKVAQVEDAKNMFAVLRETASSVSDYDDNGVLKANTILSTQSEVLEEKISPAVDKFASHIESSVDNVSLMVENFGDSLEGRFDTVLDNVSLRLEAISTIIENKPENQSWETNTTTYGDSASLLYAEENNISTSIMSLTNTDINKANIELTLKESTDDFISLVSKSGDNVFAGEGYSLTLKSLSIDTKTNKVLFELAGSIAGTDSATMSLNSLKIAFDVDETKEDSAHEIDNIEFVFDGTISADERVFNGKLTVSESDSTKNQLKGSLLGKDTEPSFEGTLTANLSLDNLKDVLDDKDKNIKSVKRRAFLSTDINTSYEATSISNIDFTNTIYEAISVSDINFTSTSSGVITALGINKNEGLSLNDLANKISNMKTSLMMQHLELVSFVNDNSETEYLLINDIYLSNISEDFSSSQTTNSYEKIYSLSNDVNITCNIQDKNYRFTNRYKTTKSCISSDDKKYTLHTIYSDYVVEATLEDDSKGIILVNYGGNYSFENRKDDIFGTINTASNSVSTWNYNLTNNNLEEDTKSIKSISIRKAKLFEDMSSNFTLQAKVTDGDSVMVVDELSVARRPFTSENVYKVNGLNMSDGENHIKVDSGSFVFKEFKGAESGMHSELLDTNKTISSEIDYNKYSAGEELVRANLSNLDISVDVNGTPLTLTSNLDLTLKDDEILKGEFIGEYTYDNTNFKGEIDIDIEPKTYPSSNSRGTARVKGTIAANGFIPFSLEASANISETTTTASILFTRESGDDTYKLAIKGELENTLDTMGDEEEKFSIKIADTNGVKFDYESNENNETEDSEYYIKNINGETLATYGEDDTGNNWELIYSDGSAETAF